MKTNRPAAWILVLLCVVESVVAFSAGAAPLPLTGVNIAGGEFWLARKPDDSVRPQYGINYCYPNQAEIKYFARQGMNFFRYPFCWETLQPKLRTPLDQTDLQRLKSAVRLATSQKLVVILDPHNYARYYGTNIVGGPTVSAADFADFWGRLAAEFKDDSHVWFGLVNEPHDMPTAQWIDAANAAIAAIRGAGARNMILVPGNSWTGAQSWLSEDYGGGSNARNIINIHDPLDYWAIEVHQYLDSDCSGTHNSVVSTNIGSARLKEFVDWCRQNHKRAILGEFAVPVVPEGQATVDDMLQSVERDQDVWLGWTWWAAGALWGDYLFTLEPVQGRDRPQMAWLRPHLGGPATPAFAVTVKSGTGGGNLVACTAHAIKADPAPAGMAFKHWTGDTAWLENPAAEKTIVTVPFKDVQVEAVFEKAM
jgi:endoglucanase